MHYFYINEDLGIIKDNNFHHIKNVLKMRTGDNIIVCFSNLCYKCVIEVNDEEITYQKLAEIESDKKLHITLFQGMLKGNKIETTLKYATMFGVKEIVLTKMLRSIQKEIPSKTKHNRYEMIIKDASMLSKQTAIPSLSYVDDVMKYDFSKYDLIIVADENEESLTVKDFKITKNAKIAIIIGPEGGFDKRERTYFQEISAKLITFGENILASEIASLYILSVLSILT